jgi:hypothetical protein
VAGTSLLVADRRLSRVRVYDRATGKLQKDIGRSGLKPGELVKPIHVFTTDAGFGVWNHRGNFGHSIQLFDDKWVFQRDIATTRPPRARIDPVICPHWHNGRLLMIAFSVGLVPDRDTSGGYIFSMAPSGEVKPIMSAGSSDEARIMGRGLRDTMGGIQTLLDGGWLAVMPGTYELLRFDAADHLTLHWQGSWEKFTPADWSTRSRQAEDEASMWRWYRTLVFVSAPIVISAQEVAVIVAPPEPAAGKRSVWLEVYNTSNGSFIGRQRLPIEPALIGDECVAQSSTPSEVVLLVQDDAETLGSPVTAYEFRVRPGALKLPGAKKPHKAQPGSVR